MCSILGYYKYDKNIKAYNDLLKHCGQNKKFVIIFNLLLIIILITLLCITFKNDLTGKEKYNNFITSYRLKLSKYKHIDNRTKTIILYKMITQNFKHGLAKHTIASNWIMYFLGKIYPPLGNVYNYKNFFKFKTLICSQSSYLMLKILNSNGIITRHVGLGGHVVVEVYYNNKYHMYDPDHRVFSEKSVFELINNPDLLHKLYNNVSIENIYETVYNNSYVAYPQGSYFVWKAEVLKYLEQLMDFLKYLLLIIFLLVLALRTKKNIKRITGTTYV